MVLKNYAPELSPVFTCLYPKYSAYFIAIMCKILKEIWDSFTPEIGEALVNTMPNGIQTVIRAMLRLINFILI